MLIGVISIVAALGPVQSWPALSHLIRQQQALLEPVRLLVVPFGEGICEVCVGVPPLESRSVLAKFHSKAPQLVQEVIEVGDFLRATEKECLGSIAQHTSEKLFPYVQEV